MSRLEQTHWFPLYIGTLVFVTFVFTSQVGISDGIDVRNGGSITLSNAYIELTFDTDRSDAPTRVTARRAAEPRPFQGSVNSGVLFAHYLELDGKPVPQISPKKVKKSVSQGSTILEFHSTHGSLDIRRRYVIKIDEAGFSDEITYRNDGERSMSIRFGDEGDVGGFYRGEPDYQHWAWKVMRWFVPAGDSLETMPVYCLQKELQDNAEPIIRETLSSEGRLNFGFVNGRALGLFVSLDGKVPLTFRTFSDRFRKKDGGRLDEIRGRWSWQSDAAVNIPPGECVSLSKRVMLLDGQGRIEKYENGLVAALDCPPYRDPGEQIEVAASLSSDRNRKLQLSLLLAGDGEKEGKTYETRIVELEAGKACRISFDRPTAAEPQVRLALTVEEAGSPPLRLEKTVFAGRSTQRGRQLAEKYHKAYPQAADFHGTLSQLGKALVNPEMRLRVGDGYPPDVALHAGQTAENAAAKIARKFNLEDADTKRFARHALGCYEKWFPNYTKILRGKAAALGLPVELLVLDEQARFDRENAKFADHTPSSDPRVENSGCIDIAFRTTDDGRIWLTWNKDRATVEGGVSIEYERCQIDDGLSFHGIANYGVNEAGFGVAGAALNEHPTVIQDGQRLVAARRAAGKTVGPPDPMMVLLAECRTVDDAERLITNPDAPLVWLGNCLMADRQGGVLAWQAAGLKHLLRRPEADWRYFTATNYPHDWTINPPDELGEGGRITMTAWFREANLRRIIKEFPTSPQLPDVFAVLRDRSEPGALEQVYWNSPKASLTVMSYVIDTKTSDLHIAYSPASQHKYLRYELKKNSN